MVCITHLKSCSDAASSSSSKFKLARRAASLCVRLIRCCCVWM